CTGEVLQLSELSRAHAAELMMRGRFRGNHRYGFSEAAGESLDGGGQSALEAGLTQVIQWNLYHLFSLPKRQVEIKAIIAEQIRGHRLKAIILQNLLAYRATICVRVQNIHLQTAL